MSNYKYDVIGADLDYGVKKHPISDIMNIGFNIIKAEPCMLADCWWFRSDTDVKEIPPYIIKLSDDFKFSDER